MNILQQIERSINNLEINSIDEKIISKEKNNIELILNKTLYDSKSSGLGSFFFGSYARGTAISTQNINVLYEMPLIFLKNDISCNVIVDKITQNLPSRYKLNFSEESKFINIFINDDISFDFLPAFLNNDGSYTYRVSGNCDLWAVTNVRIELNEFNKNNQNYHQLPLKLGIFSKLWKNALEIDINGYLIDTLIYHFFTLYSVKEITNLSMHRLFKMFMQFLTKQDKEKYFWLSPGANHYVVKTDDFHEKAEETLKMLNTNDVDNVISYLRIS